MRDAISKASGPIWISSCCNGNQVEQPNKKLHHGRVSSHRQSTTGSVHDLNSSRKPSISFMPSEEDDEKVPYKAWVVVGVELRPELKPNQPDAVAVPLVESAEIPVSFLVPVNFRKSNPSKSLWRLSMIIKYQWHRFHESIFFLTQTHALNFKQPSVSLSISSTNQQIMSTHEESVSISSLLRDPIRILTLS